ncbi:hypothetical protein [Priestia abyssalis]|nr:hypothetical protein [Priestia abyssalis]
MGKLYSALLLLRANGFWFGRYLDRYLFSFTRKKSYYINAFHS